MRHERGRHLWFEVSDVPAGERIVGAELRLYQTPGMHKNAIIQVYELVADNGEKALRLVDSAAATGGWLVFNVTGPFSTWVAIPDSNHGLYLSVHFPEKPGEHIYIANCSNYTT